MKEDPLVSIFDKAKDKAEQAMGTAKEKLGNATDNDDLRDSGKADQTSGEVKEAGHDLRDKAQGAVQDAKDKFGN
ncbi:CsbD family protein [Amycolatopsis minnesotensis]|uniref:CsbD family protein n=1 Tax=Amycolatopsis minnesotensis TaxID=337894 RepID=A0ABN2S682_9PSEU